MTGLLVNNIKNAVAYGAGTLTLLASLIAPNIARPTNTEVEPASGSKPDLGFIYSKGLHGPTQTSTTLVSENLWSQNGEMKYIRVVYTFKNQNPESGDLTVFTRGKNVQKFSLEIYGSRINRTVQCDGGCTIPISKVTLSEVRISATANYKTYTTNPYVLMGNFKLVRASDGTLHINVLCLRDGVEE